MKFFHPADRLPPPNETVLVRGWGEAKNHYIWGFAEYTLETASARWVDKNIHGLGEQTLWFDPVGWAFLPQPK